ncbi:MAG: hypothetical protein SVC26_06560 [Pseudomonadota bacterium]|nr:hypothetical protein [Pseudomonadota bacterium]
MSNHINDKNEAIKYLNKVVALHGDKAVLEKSALKQLENQNV